MSKTIEEIKEEVSREFLNPYRTWLENSRFSNDDNISVLEDSGAIDEVVKRYAKSQTQELKEQNAELVEMLNEIYNDRLWGNDKDFDKLKDLIIRATELNQM